MKFRGLAQQAGLHLYYHFPIVQDVACGREELLRANPHQSMFVIIDFMIRKPSFTSLALNPRNNFVVDLVYGTDFPEQVLHWSISLRLRLCSSGLRV